MAFLKIDKLTMRFGGLTAVGELDLDVPPGSIYSVIGPNGAGKTTVFNVVTGVYSPTQGAIAFEGRELRRPFGWKVLLLCASVGILTSIAALFASIDVNALWRAVVKRNRPDQNTSFSYGDAAHDLWGYLAGHMAVEQRGADKKWLVVPWNDSRPVLGVADEKLAARELAALLDTAIASSPAESRPSRGEHWQLDSAKATSSALFEIARERSSQIRLEWLSFVCSLIVATAATYVVWNRARRTPDVIAAGGIARTFQNIRLFTSMTVLENVQVAMARMSWRNVFQLAAIAVSSLGAAWVIIWIVAPSAASPLRDNKVLPSEATFVEWAMKVALLLALIAILGFALWQKARDERESVRRAFDGLDFVGLQPKAAALAGSLAYGDQRRLEIARALALKPRLLLLDEPAAGMNPIESAELTKLIRRIRESGVTVLLIEHHMKVVMGISDRLAVLDHGVKIAEGAPGEVRANPRVIEAYLGKEEQE